MNDKPIPQDALEAAAEALLHTDVGRNGWTESDVETVAKALVAYAEKRVIEERERLCGIADKYRHVPYARAADIANALRGDQR